MKFKLLGDHKQIENNDTGQPIFSVNQVSKRDIAIIGIGGTFASAETKEQFWELLRSGKDCNVEFPQSRRDDVEDYMEYLRQMGLSQEGLEYSVGGFLPEIDKFDPAFFHLSPREAALMDPKQRIMLQTLWTAIEDAGYGGDSIAGSRTGVFLGESNDFYDSYRHHLLLQNVDDYGHSVVSNINSITASRVSYLLNLKGPAIMIDTACSSSLVAIHMACQSIRNKECDMALAGGVNVLLTPYRGEKRWEIGIQASDGRAKTFDHASDGTGTGEGAGAVLLKPLYKALQDRDPIYAVIKGSAVNQDGASAGITTPNASAQEEVIVRAWMDAGIEPETVSYMEAHGTGTKLGDPIEINGMTRAFARYTDKKQFCAVGSVKTNIGHLDNCASMAGFIKNILALQHQELPPTLHFQTPNQKIAFIHSPLYVNDTLQPWTSEEGRPRRCGISSFGLSGTNCHVVLEEGPSIPDVNGLESDSPKNYIFTVSAQNEEGIRDLVGKYKEHFDAYPGLSLRDTSYTATIGRGHYSYRLAILADGMESLKRRLEIVWRNLAADEEQGIYYGMHKMVPDLKTYRQKGELTDQEKSSLSTQCARNVKEFQAQGEADESLQAIARLYVQGADVRWSALYDGIKCSRVHLPVYPFQKIRCWMTRSATDQRKEPVVAAQTNATSGSHIHPVLHRLLVDTPQVAVYSTEFSVEDQWVVNEHQVLGEYVVPGTTYLEMAREIGCRMYGDKPLHMTGVTFLHPLIVRPKQAVVASVIVSKDEDSFTFSIMSKSSEAQGWITHAEGQLRPAAPPELSDSVSIEHLKLKCPEEQIIQYDHLPEGAVQTGPRWNNVERVHLGHDEAILTLQLPAGFTDDLHQYSLHPALMDCAANAANAAFGGGTYLPYLYKSFQVFGPTPAKFYSHVVKKSLQKGGETETFDITMTDEAGRIFVSIRDYTIKKVHEHKGLTSAPLELYRPIWIPTPAENGARKLQAGTVVIFIDDQGIGISLAGLLRDQGRRVIEVLPGHDYERMLPDYFKVPSTEAGFCRLWNELKDTGFEQVIDLSAVSEPKQERLDAQLEHSVYRLFHLAHSWKEAKWKHPLEWIVVSSGGAAVDGSEEELRPHHAAMNGLAKVLDQEFPNVHVASIDIDSCNSAQHIFAELQSISDQADCQIAYRNGIRYVLGIEPLELKNSEAKALKIVPDGVYVITGGTGGIGLEIGKYLASLAPVRLVMINRSPVPDRSDWPHLIDSTDSLKLKDRLQKMLDIEQGGTSIYTYAADVANEQQLEKIIAEVTRKLGPIRGIVHAAGVAGDGYMLRKDMPTFRSVIAPKIQGTWNLDKCVDSSQLDFFVMCSSVTAITGGPGQGDYTAANCFMDLFANYKERKGQTVLSINWPAWKETGMAVDYGVEEAPALWKSIRTHTAIRYLDTLLRYPIRQAIVGQWDDEQAAEHVDQLPFRLSGKMLGDLKRSRSEATQAHSHSNDREQASGVRLTGKPEQELTATERKVAQIWSAVLGLEEVDVYVNFYDSGGDSILATQLYRKLDGQFPQMIDISDVFSYSSVFEMAGYLDSLGQGESSSEKDAQEDEYDVLLKKLISGELTPEEASKLVTEG